MNFDEFEAWFESQGYEVALRDERGNLFTAYSSIGELLNAYETTR